MDWEWNLGERRTYLDRGHGAEQDDRHDARYPMDTHGDTMDLR